jgi:hypothetical protein
MKARSWRLLSLFALTAAVTMLLLGGAAYSGTNPGNAIIAHQLDIELGKKQAQKWERHLSTGIMYTALEAAGALNGQGGGGSRGNPNGASCASKLTGGGQGAAKNVRVNQDCSLRRQAEEVIAVNPTDPNNLIAGQNDSVIGFNHCGYDYSFDGGKTWGGQVPPFWQFVLLDGHTADACSDPTVTFDSKGNAYAGGVIFDVASAANAIVVVKSNAGIGGAFYHTPAQIPAQTFSTAPLGVVANLNDPAKALDKEFIVADSTPTSPKADNVYATYTLFELTGAGVGIHSPIYFSQSTDGGTTWSPGVEISGSNAAACTDFSGEADVNACDQDQGSDPIVGPDGTIYVSFLNGNTPNPGENQHMIVSCPASADCSNSASWSAPVKITDDFGKQPIGPVASTACPAGRQCLPPNGYRVQDETYGSITIDSSGRLYHVFSDARNLGANCNPLGPAATATPPCDTDVFYSSSSDGGATWSDVQQLTPAGSAQWMPWGAVTSDGKKLYVAYYDRSYGDCEQTGCNDITLATVANAATASPSVKYSRITTASMPNLVVANNPVQAGFLGDYMWVTTDPKGRALIAWADTRGRSGTVEEDIYFAQTP